MLRSFRNCASLFLGGLIPKLYYRSSIFFSCVLTDRLFPESETGRAAEINQPNGLDPFGQRPRHQLELHWQRDGGSRRRKLGCWSHRFGTTRVSPVSWWRRLWHAHALHVTRNEKLHLWPPRQSLFKLDLWRSDEIRYKSLGEMIERIWRFAFEICNLCRPAWFTVNTFFSKWHLHLTKIGSTDSFVRFILLAHLFYIYFGVNELYSPKTILRS